MIEQTETPKKWYQESILFKLCIISIIILALLIPSSWIQDLITEREGYQHQMVNTMTDNWAGRQLVQGPVLVLPYKKHADASNADKKDASHDVIDNLYLLPESLKITGAIKTQLIEKGVYDAVVYNSTVRIQGSFNKPDAGSLGINPNDILYDRAKLVFSLSDMKGLNNNPEIKINDQEYKSEPATVENSPFTDGLQVSFPLQGGQSLDFNYQLDLKGSSELSFMPTGKTTDVDITGDWKSPDFNDSPLPDSKAITANGFSAKWHRLYYERLFPRQWTGNDTSLISKKAITQASFGVKLQLPVDQYHKIMRTAKYSVLIILLTFISLFLTELIKKQSIHLFNYTLIGAAMVVYYTLLLSFSEQIGFNYAYLLSSISTIVLIATFTASLLKNNPAAIIFALILSIFYGFIYVIIQLEELSLLFGSVGLFVIIAVLMYFSRKINWDRN